MSEGKSEGVEGGEEVGDGENLGSGKIRTGSRGRVTVVVSTVASK